MSRLVALLVLAQEAESADLAEEGKRIIIGMLLVGLTFLAVIALGQLSRYLTRRRRARRAARRVY
ncbi:MAG: hypothetical protein ICV71_04995 [Thermoleophilia bacterium]|nr:hypothetical protein [Thermoleophilia bacterium]MDQ3858091.1 hypothetical protein [Actinomycetota bacterium]